MSSVFATRFLDRPQDLRWRTVACPPQLSNQTHQINSPNLVEDNLTRPAFEPPSHPRGMAPSPCRDWGHNDTTDMVIHFVGRNDQARSCLLDLAADGRVQVDQVNLKTVYHHSHSASSHEVGIRASPSTRTWSPTLAILRKTASHPARRRAGGPMMRRFPST